MGYPQQSPDYAEPVLRKRFKRHPKAQNDISGVRLGKEYLIRVRISGVKLLYFLRVRMIDVVMQVRRRTLRQQFMLPSVVNNLV